MLFLSIIIFLCGFLLTDISKNAKLFTMWNILVLFVFSSISGLYHIVNYFTNEGINEAAIYHLLTGIGEAGLSEYPMIILESLVLIFLLIIFIFVYIFLLRKKIPILNFRHRWLVVSVLILVSFVTNPGVRDLTGFIKNNFYRTSYNLDITKFYLTKKPIKEEFSEKFLRVYKNKVQSVEQEPLNLVFIYGESLERTYTDELLFPGLLGGLKGLGVSYDFIDINQVWGTGWTIAGMFASQCGLPLAVGYNKMVEGMSDFYPRATCLGDILSLHGYHLSFLQGTSLRFSGLDNIYQSHNFDDIIGKRKLEKVVSDKSYHSGWGFYDDTLLDFSLEKIKKIVRKKKRHATFIATMDTHAPKGLVSKSCRTLYLEERKESILNAVFCSGNLIVDFIKKLQTSEIGKNTLIVLVSDHLSMRNNEWNKLESRDRKNLFLVIDPRNSKKHLVKRPGTLMDIGPTVLNLMGLKVDGLGFGRDLLGNKATLYKNNPDFESQIKDLAPDIMLLWDQPRVPKTVDIDRSEQEIIISKHRYDFPLIFSVDKRGRILPDFDVNIAKKFKRLDEQEFFFWIDKCEIINKFLNRDEKGLWCASNGNIAGRIDVENIDFSNKYHLNLFGKMKSSALKISKIDKKKLVSKNRVVQQLPQEKVNNNAKDISRFIAHAGGKINGHIYTNSMEALNSSYKQGFRLFELDISKTSDGVYVAAHDWRSWKNKTQFNGEIPPTVEVFRKTQRLSKMTSIDITMINRWFKDHPDATLVTDKVNEPLDFIKQFHQKNQLIMELFSEKAVKEATESGISAMAAWDSFVHNQTDPLKYILENDIKYLTIQMSEVSKNRDLLEELFANGVKVYVFHVNYYKAMDEAYAVCNLSNFVYGMYADSWDFPSYLKCD